VPCAERGTACELGGEKCGRGGRKGWGRHKRCRVRKEFGTGTAPRVNKLTSEKN
jgi:hypothetical protein